MKDRGKKSRTVRKVTKGLYFSYLGKSPRWTEFNQNLLGVWCPRRNHVCQVSYLNFHGLRFYRGSNFPFSYWFLHGPYNSDQFVCQCVCVSHTNELNAVQIAVFNRSSRNLVPRQSRKRCDHRLLLVEMQNIHVCQTESAINFYHCPYGKIDLMLNISKTVRYTMLDSKEVR